MTWTYDNSPGTVARDEVRFLVGDTDTTDQLVTDEEIAYAIAEEGSGKLAAAAICEAIAAKFARQADEAVGDLKLSKSQRSKAYAERAAQLRSRQAVLAMPWAGGLSVTGKADLEADTDRVAPAIKLGVHSIETE